MASTTCSWIWKAVALPDGDVEGTCEATTLAFFDVHPASTSNPTSPIDASLRIPTPLIR
jgi:hypothetical protein